MKNTVHLVVTALLLFAACLHISISASEQQDDTQTAAVATRVDTDVTGASQAELRTGTYNVIGGNRDVIEAIIEGMDASATRKVLDIEMKGTRKMWWLPLPGAHVDKHACEETFTIAYLASGVVRYELQNLYWAEKGPTRVSEALEHAVYFYDGHSTVRVDRSRRGVVNTYAGAHAQVDYLGMNPMDAAYPEFGHKGGIRHILATAYEKGDPWNLRLLEQRGSEYALEMSDSRGTRIVYQLDSQKGFAVGGYEAYLQRQGGETHLYRSRDIELMDSDGIWTPRKITENLYDRHGNKTNHNTLTLTQCKVNQGLTIDDLRPLLPSSVKTRRIVGKDFPGLNVAEWVKSEPTTLTALKGKIVVLALSNFEDETRAELVQSLTQVREEHSTADLEIITVYASGTDADQLDKFFSDHLSAYRVAVDNPSTSASYEGATCEKYAVEELPAVFIIDTEGRVRYQDIPLEAVEQALKQLIDE